MRVFLATLAGLLILCPTVWADTVAELQILQEFFSNKGVENRSARLTGAALQHYLQRPMVGEYLPEGATVEYRLLSEDGTSAVYEAILLQDGNSQMWSAFFQRTLSGSKLEAIPTLHIPPYLYEVEYRRLLAQTGQSAIAAARLKQLQRLFMSTAAFKDDFINNRPTYEAIAKLVESGKTEEAQGVAREAALVGVRIYGESKSEGEMALLVSPAAGKGEKKNGQLGSELRVSGFLDSVLGLLHLPAGVNPPPLSARDYIFVEALAENWYLFRNINAEPLKEKSGKND